MEKLTSSLRNEPRTAPFPSSILQVTQNEDLLISILSLLPTKSVIRFKSVSKLWLSLISQPSFSLLHVTHSPPQPPSALLFPHPNNPSLIHPFPLPLSNNCSFTPSSSLNFTDDPTGEIQIVQSCNGLLLCSSGTPWDGIDTQVFYVFNPTTKKFSTIHHPATRSGRAPLSIFTKINLAFDPSKSPDYKVLLVGKADGGPNCFQFNIYCSKIQKWYQCGDMVEWPCFEVFCNGVYLDGAVYWASKCNGFLCFDIDRECFSVMPQLPGFRNSRCTVRYFGELCGHLYLVDAQGLQFDVFEMGRDCSNWIPKFQVDLGRIIDAYPCVFSQSQGEFFVKETTKVSLISVVCEEGGLCLVFHVGDKILSYDVKSGGIKVIRDGFEGDVEWMVPALVKGFGGYQHFDSLACV